MALNDLLRVEEPLTYGVFSDSELDAARPRRGRKVAVLVTHGMGQQSKFDTLDQVVTGLADDARKVARNVRIGDQSISRLELELTEGNETREVHLYEAYWAPFTEGKVTIMDVTGFLKSAAINGVKNAWKGFHRWLFGDYPLVLGPKPGWRTVKFLLLALGVLLSLIFMNSVVVAIGGAHFAAALSGGSSKSWLKDPQTVDDLTLAALLFCAAGVAFFGTMRSAGRQKPLPNDLPLVSKMSFYYFFAVTGATMMAAVVMLAAIGAGRMRANAGVTWMEWVEQGIAAFAVFATGLLMLWGAVICGTAALRSGVNTRVKSEAAARLKSALMALLLIVAAPAFLYAAAAEGGKSVFVLTTVPGLWVGSHLIALRPLFNLVAAVSHRWVLIWPALFYVSNRARQFFIQYVGDVAAYVTPHTLDRFNDVREKIKDCVGKVAETIYRAKEGDALMYDRVVVVGHSLGSAIAYDTLNRMLNLDYDTGGRLQVADRTSRIITFGSPLDKFAFLFASNVQRVGWPVRAALAATVQPLVAFEKAREKIAWTNIYSPMDIISGELNFFDMKQPLPFQKIDNICDYDAVTPLAAHTEYWGNPLVWQKTRAAFFSAAAAPRVPRPAVVVEKLPIAGTARITISIAGATAKGNQIVQLPAGTNEVEVEWC